MKKFLSALATFSLLLFGATSEAADRPSLKVEPGVAFPLTKPQSERFDVGGALTLKPLFGLTRHLDVGPSVSALSFPSLSNGPAGNALAVGGTFRLKRPHDETNTGTGLTAVSPWVDADYQYVRTGDLDRTGFMAAVGASVPTGSDRTVWVGPFVRYQGILQLEKDGYDTRDARVLIVGLSVELSPFAKKQEEKKVEPQPQPQPQPPPKVVPPQEKPKPLPPKPPSKFELTERVQFKVDSAELLPTQMQTLENVYKFLSAHADCSVVVEGHASSEGPPEPYNTKLSQRRATAVMNYLKSRGIPAEKMTAVGFSSSQPVASNETEEGRVKNRRVQFQVTIVMKEGAQ